MDLITFGSTLSWIFRVGNICRQRAKRSPFQSIYCFFCYSLAISFSDPIIPKKEAFIKAKYVQLNYAVRPPKDSNLDDLNKQLWCCVRTSHVETTLRYADFVKVSSVFKI